MHTASQRNRICPPYTLNPVSDQPVICSGLLARQTLDIKKGRGSGFRVQGLGLNEALELGDFGLLL